MTNLPGLTTPATLSQDFGADPTPIEMLMTRAGEHGDRDQVELCRRAIAGDQAAIAACEAILAEKRGA